MDHDRSGTVHRLYLLLRRQDVSNSSFGVVTPGRPLYPTDWNRTLSYAALFGIRADLNLVGTNYSTLSSIFYVGWLLWALPGNLLMAKFPLSKYLGLNVSDLRGKQPALIAQIFLWGAFLIAQGGSQDFKDMLILRLISGAFEAVAKPAFSER